MADVGSSGWEYTKQSYSETAQFAVEKAAEVISPLRVKLLGLSLSGRSYAPAVEMYRQLGYTSASSSTSGDDERCNGSDGNAGAWIHVPQLSETVVCDANQLTELIDQSKILSGSDQPVLFDFDHTYPVTQPAKPELTAVLYGVMGTTSMTSLHAALVKLAEAGKVNYVLRHLPPKDGPAIPLQVSRSVIKCPGCSLR